MWPCTAWCLFVFLKVRWYYGVGVLLMSRHLGCARLGWVKRRPVTHPPASPAQHPLQLRPHSPHSALSQLWPRLQHSRQRPWGSSSTPGLWRGHTDTETGYNTSRMSATQNFQKKVNKNRGLYDTDWYQLNCPWVFSTCLLLHRDLESAENWASTKRH